MIRCPLVLERLKWDAERAQVTYQARLKRSNNPSAGMTRWDVLEFIARITDEIRRPFDALAVVEIMGSRLRLSPEDRIGHREKRTSRRDRFMAVKIEIDPRRRQQKADVIFRTEVRCCEFTNLPLIMVRRFSLGASGTTRKPRSMYLFAIMSQAPYATL
jgi:hypothetical protein